MSYVGSLNRMNSTQTVDYNGISSRFIAPQKTDATNNLNQNYAITQAKYARSLTEHFFAHGIHLHRV